MISQEYRVPGCEQRFPHHVAIIMDGSKSGPAGAAAVRGIMRIEECIQAAIALGISNLTLCDPWPKSRCERDRLGYAARFAEGFNARDWAELNEHNVRLRLIGGGEGFSPSRTFNRALAAARTNTGLQLTLAPNYSGRDEILRAVKALVAGICAGKPCPEEITESLAANYFDTSGLPDPDLLILTNGKRDLSNVLLWQCAYSEFLFIEDAWPEFTRHTLEKAVADYGKRERRFGAVPSA